MGATDIFTILENHGISGIILLGLAVLFISILKTEWFNTILVKISSKIGSIFTKREILRNTNIIGESNINSHEIFNYIDLWINSKVPTLKFSTEYRTFMFRKYLTIYLKSHKRKIQEFINTKKYQEIEDSKVWPALLELINQIVEDYETEMEKNSIPKIIIEKMKVKNNDSINLSIDIISRTCHSKFYESDKNFLKIYSILNIFSSMLDSTIIHSEETCNSINGQLKGLKFIDGNNIIIEP